MHFRLCISWLTIVLNESVNLRVLFVLTSDKLDHYLGILIAFPLLDFERNKDCPLPDRVSYLMIVDFLTGSKRGKMQGRIHASISRVRLGRGSDAV